MNLAQPLEDLIPHRGGVVLLSHVLEHTEDETVCGARVGSAGLFANPDGRVAGGFALEYLAQAVAVHAGLTLARHGQAPRIGLLLSARDCRVSVAFLEPEQELVARARCIRESENGLVSFDCALSDARDGSVLARGRVSCYLTDTLPASEAMP